MAAKESIQTRENTNRDRTLRLLARAIRRVPNGRTMDRHADNRLTWDSNTGLWLEKKK